MQQDNDKRATEYAGMASIFGIRLNGVSEQLISKIASWAILAGSVGFLVMVISLIGIYKNVLFLFKFGLNDRNVLAALLGVGYFVLNFLLNLFLLRVGILLKRALAGQLQQELAGALVVLRNYMRLLAGYLIVVIVFVLIVFAMFLFRRR